jgi:hypothetical protein
MRRQVLGLHSMHQDPEGQLEGFFLVRVERGWYRWHPQKPYLEVSFRVVEPRSFQDRSFFGRLYCTERAMWKLYWFLRDFGYDADLLYRDLIDERALVNLQGVVHTSQKTWNVNTYQDLTAFAPAGDWEIYSSHSSGNSEGQKDPRGSNGL